MATRDPSAILQKYFPQYYKPLTAIPSVGAGKSNALLDQIIARYQPGGDFGKPEEALLKQQKKKSGAQTAQDLVSAGLSGTTVGAGTGQRWEQEIGMPARLKLEDIRSQRLTEALGAKVQYQSSVDQQNTAIAEANRQAQLQQLQMQKGLSFGGHVEQDTSNPYISGGFGTQPRSASGSVSGGSGGTGDSGGYGGSGGFGLPSSMGGGGAGTGPSGPVTPASGVSMVGPDGKITTQPFGAPSGVPGVASPTMSGGGSNAYTYSWQTHLATGARYIGRPPTV